MTFQERGSGTSCIYKGLVDSLDDAYSKINPAVIISFLRIFNGGVDYVLTKLSDEGLEASCIQFAEGEKLYNKF